MDQKQQRIDQDRDDQKSGRPVQLDKDKHQDNPQHGGQHQQQHGQPGGARPMPESPKK